ncbi:MAG: hypothetical protein FD167_5965 [bacterium]|nr:MAG: hypothetical protein FD167_5965 [bacterium]
MNPGAVLAVTLFSLMISFGLTAAALATRGFWPNLAEELDTISLSNSLWRRFLVGLVNAFISFIIFAITTKHEILGLIGLAILLLVIIFTFLGLIAEVCLWGRRILILRNSGNSLFAQTLAGGITLSVILLIPFAGQIIFFVVLFQSLGTTIYWLFQRKRLNIRLKT